MQVRQRPPTFKSISQTGHDMPSGPHHCANSLGSVKAAKTRAGGAKNWRSMRRTRSSLLAAGAAAALAMAFLLRVALAGEQLVERVETCFPEGAIALDPFRRLLERLGREAAAPPLRLALAGNEPRALEHLQMARDGRQRDLERLRPLVHRRLARGQAPP